MHQTRDHSAPPYDKLVAPRGWAVVALLCAAQFMLILDITVVNVALPAIHADVGIALGDLQWVVTAYTLAFGGLVLLGGRAAACSVGGGSSWPAWRSSPPPRSRRRLPAQRAS
jgi:MFS family permease